MKVAATVFSSFVLAAFLFTYASAQSASEIQDQIASHNQQIEELNKEIEKYETELQEVGERRHTLQSTLSQLDLQRKKLNASISITKNKIGTLQLEIQELSRGIASKEDLIANDKAGLAESMRRLDEVERKTIFEALLSNEGLSAVWEEMDAHNILQGAVRNNIAELSAQKQSLSDTKEETETKRTQLVREQNNLFAEQGSLDATRKAQNELIAETKSQESAYQSLIQQKQTEKATFEAALFELASQLDYVLDPNRIPPAGKGILRWPLDNVFVTQQFGKTSVSGRLYASGTHDGIDFRASIGTPVKASLSGTVMQVNYGAVQNCQYGKWVLIKHNNGLATLYAHLSDISVQEGQAIATGQVIGYSGNTGYATGPHLHMTVYVAESVSYKQYTCKSGRVVIVPIAPLTGYLNPLDYL
jgi:murein DD-endopeptidase MepM/ murein hydrolase activator NlpD